MSEEKDRVVHEVDGIEEYDNALPRWWLATFFGAMAFSAVYWYAYQSAGFAELPLAQYQVDLQRRAATSGTVSAELLTTLSSDPATVAKGQLVFAQTCAPCHRADGGGNVGPNLTDDYSIHGFGPTQIWKTVAEGVPDKGMPAWKLQLGSERVQAVTAYVMTLRGKPVPNGKAPQGTADTLGQRL